MKRTELLFWFKSDVLTGTGSRCFSLYNMDMLQGLVEGPGMGRTCIPVLPLDLDNGGKGGRKGRF